MTAEFGISVGRTVRTDTGVCSTGVLGEKERFSVKTTTTTTTATTVLKFPSRNRIWDICPYISVVPGIFFVFLLRGNATR